MINKQDFHDVLTRLHNVRAVISDAYYADGSSETVRAASLKDTLVQLAWIEGYLECAAAMAQEESDW